MTRRSRRALAAAAALAPALGLAACGDTVSDVWADGSDDAAGGSAAATVSAPAEPFIYRDARGVTVTLEQQPEVVVAQSSVAAALWDVGYQVDGVYGELDDPTGYQTGSLDLARTTVLGRTFGEFDVAGYRALRPDLLVDLTTDQSTLSYLPPEQADDVLAVAPAVAVPGVGFADTDAAVDAVLELADELGADTDSAEVQRDRAAYDDALDDVAALAAPDLQVLVVTRDADTLYVADPAFFPELGSLAAAGVQLVRPEGESAAFHALDWEQAAKFAAADVILYDGRERPGVAEQVEQLEAWRALPAVQAGQVYPWYTGAPYSYRAYTAVFRGVAGWLAEARPVG